MMMMMAPIGKDSHVIRHVLVTVIALCVTLRQEVRAQKQQISNEASVMEEGAGGPSPTPGAIPSQEEDALENTVFAEMLRIVDQKFDSLSARISVLERSINSLNFYSVRQFREIAKGVEESTEASDRLRTQIIKLDSDDRALKAAVTQVSRDINVIKKKMGVIDVRVSDVRADVDSVQKTTKEFRFNSEKMLDDIATSIVYLNENTKQKAEDLKGYMGTRLDGGVDLLMSQLQEDRAVVLRSVEDLQATPYPPHLPTPPALHPQANCSVDLGPMEERLNKKFAEIQRQTQSHFLDLLNAEDDDDEVREGNDVHNGASLQHGGNNAGEQAPAANQGAGRMRENGEGGDRRRSGREEGEGGGRDGEKVMTMLANMTRTVTEAVSYFKHTGAMMERLLSTTEDVAQQQSLLRYEVLGAGGLQPSGFLDDSQQADNASRPYPDYENNNDDDVDDNGDDNNDPDSAGSQDGAGAERKFHFPPRPSDYHAAKASLHYRGMGDLRPRRLHQRSGLESGAPPEPYSNDYANPGDPALPQPLSNGAGGEVGLNSEKSLAVLAELTRNGTQLLDVLTDLAQLSSSSLTKAVGSLHQEVVRLEDVRARLNQGLLFPGGNKDSSSSSQSGHVSGVHGLGACGDLGGLTNTTRTIFTIVEAIASNTGWIPYIFHNMQQVERLTNKTLELAKRSLLSVHLQSGLGSPGEGAGGQGGEEGEHSPLQPEGSRPEKAASPQAEALDVIYAASLQMLRILPALTKLVAEPEPLVALVDGGSSAEGRVELFFKGHWGAVCADSMGHSEADAICKHLGHTGGISAGDEHFGRSRSGRHWRLNTTCLDAHALLCSQFLVPDNGSSLNVECSTGHFAVICDHMLRLSPIPEDEGEKINNDSNSNDNDKEEEEEVNSTIHTGVLSLYHQGRWLPICSYGWSGYEARVACKQLGYKDGRELDYYGKDAAGNAWPGTAEANSTKVWVTGVSCTGEESRLDACIVGSFQDDTCTNDEPPAAVRCQ